MTVQAQPQPAPAPAVVVFGLDELGKAHASFFIETEIALAEKAAGLMGMSLLPVRTDAERALAAKVPRGRVFASGRAFLPFTKAAIYAELRALAPEAVAPLVTVAKVADIKQSPAESLSVSDADSPDKPLLRPASWNDIEAGAIVLAAAPTDVGWYECAVLAVEGDDGLQLKYCEFPKEPIFTAQRSQVGLMPFKLPEGIA